MYFIDLLIITGLILILIEFKTFKNSTNYIIILSLIFLFVIKESSIINTDLFIFNPWKIIFLSLITICFLIILELIKDKTFDIYSLFILVYLGSIVLILSDNLLTLYLGLELQTFSTFILIAKNRNSIIGSEAGLKYFILGALSSGFYLLGLTLLFLFGFDFNIKNLLLLINEDIILIACSLIILSFSFKLSLFPLHFWIPDIYEGSSWDVLTLISTLPKISVICVLTQLLLNSSILLFCAIFSIIIGTIGALNQSKLKRLLAYSGISHMGFIILGFIILNSKGNLVGNLYLTIYIITMLSILILIFTRNNNNDFIIELGGLNFINKVVSISIILLVLSIAGIPPLSGFISKWYLIWINIEFEYYISSIVIIIFSAIGAGYYLRLVKILYFQKKSSYLIWKYILNIKNDLNEIVYITLGFFMFITMFLLFNFEIFINIINYVNINNF